MYYPLMNSVEVASKIKSIIETLNTLQCELSELYEDLALPLQSTIEKAEQPGALFFDDNAGPGPDEVDFQISDSPHFEIIAKLQKMERRHNRQLETLSGAIMRVVEMAGLQDGKKKERRIGF